MQTQSISARPIQRDMISHHIRSTGEFPRTQYIAIFTYADGSVREYDGREWKLTRKSHKEINPNLWAEGV